MRGGVLSLFSGAGGLDLGAHLAGLEIGLATDANRAALETLSSMEFAGPSLLGDVETLINEGGLRRAWGKGSPRILIGGPPCTGFSHAGFWIAEKRNGNDPAVTLVQRYMDVVEEFQPMAFILENVPGLAFKTHRAHLDDLVSRATAMGYSVNSAILNAANFGTAQARRRLFVVGSKGEGVDLSTWPTFPCRSSSWAIGSLESSACPEPDEEISGEYSQLLRDIPNGSNYIYYTSRGQSGQELFKYRGRYWSFLLKIDPGKPSPTISAQRVTFNGPFHWRSRHLRVPELARLQGFPDGVSWTSNLSSARMQIGNSVPPLMAAAVVWRVRQSLRDVPARWMPPALEAAQDPKLSFEELSSVMASV